MFSAVGQFLDLAPVLALAHGEVLAVRWPRGGISQESCPGNIRLVSG